MPDTPANPPVNPPASQPASQPLTGASLPLRVADLPTRRPQPFHLRPGPEARARIIADLGISGLRKLDFRGTLQAEGRHDWRLEGRLGASVVQPCVITAEPVTTRIDINVLRRFLRDLPEPAGAEAEMPEDDTLEPLGPVIDPGAVMVEALAIALPDYPRAPGAELGEAGFAPPGAAPIDGARRNPFAALAALKGLGDEGAGGEGESGEGEGGE